MHWKKMGSSLRSPSVKAFGLVTSLAILIRSSEVVVDLFDVLFLDAGPFKICAREWMPGHSGQRRDKRSEM